MANFRSSQGVVYLFPCGYPLSFDESLLSCLVHPTTKAISKAVRMQQGRDDVVHAVRRERIRMHFTSALSLDKGSQGVLPHELSKRNPAASLLRTGTY